MDAGEIMARIKVEIDSDVMKELRQSLKERHEYTYSGSDEDLAMNLIDSLEGMPGDELVDVLLGCLSPEELLG